MRMSTTGVISVTRGCHSHLETRRTVENPMSCDVEEWMKNDGVALSGSSGGVEMFATICFSWPVSIEKH